MKWDYYGTDVIPAWVADMDFMVPDPVLVALHERIDHGVFGYTLAPKDLKQLIVERFRRLYQMDVREEWIVFLPGLVPGFNIAARAFGGDGKEVLTNTPVYPPFLRCGENNGHHTAGVDLVCDGTQWKIDFDAMEQAVTENTYMLLLCSPHNPTGRLWTRRELLDIAAFCREHDLLICSDEIHCDLILETKRAHVPVCSLSDDALLRTITLMAPSKTFNIAGLNCSFAVIAHDSLRRRYQAAMQGLIPFVNTLGYTGAVAAYREGGEWLEQVLQYLRGNHQIVLDAVNGMAGVSMCRVEATYMAWLDVRGTGLDDPFAHFLERGVAFSDGKLFGAPGYLRLNFACPRSRLQKILDCLR